MSDEDIRDPRVVPRWMEVGISGVPRSREWELVAVVELPELEGSELSEVGFRILGDGSVVDVAEPRPSETVVERVAADIRRALELPCEVRAARRGVLEWAIAGRKLRLELIDLPDLGSVEELAVALAPDGSRTVLADGEEVDGEPVLQRAAAELERRGLERFPAFVARAVRSAAGWELTVDPL